MKNCVRYKQKLNLTQFFILDVIGMNFKEIRTWFRSYDLYFSDNFEAIRITRILKFEMKDKFYTDDWRPYYNVSVRIGEKFYFIVDLVVTDRRINIDKLADKLREDDRVIQSVSKIVDIFKEFKDDVYNIV